MKKILTILLLAALATTVHAQSDTTTVPVDSFAFSDIIVLPTTAVKDQNKSGTCWCFSGTSFIEDEILRKGGDSIHLSEMYTVRRCYSDKADKYVRYYGDCNFAQGGSCPDVTYVMKKYGAMPNDAYPGLNYGEPKHVHGELVDLLKGYLGVIAKRSNKKITNIWRNGYEGILDAYLGEMPETFEYKGKTYTPQTFMQSLGINPDDYVGITSFTHQPLYEPFILEIPDNWINYQYYNVKLDEMKAIVDNALQNGYPVAWAADVSEKGFKWYKGVALMPKAKDPKDMNETELSRWVELSESDRANDAYNFNGPVDEIEVTQELRQQMFDSQETTDDHGMEIVGVALDQKGNRYYKVKNSWDTDQKYKGYIYVSEPYFLAKTIDIYVHRDAVPKDIAKKLKLK